MALLLVLTLDGTGESRQLSAGGLTVGRAENNDWVLTDISVPPALSRRHCRFDMGLRGATVTDLGSTNGTILDGRPLAPRKPTPLRGGESIEIGLCRLLVEIAESDTRASELPALDVATADPSIGVRGLSMPPARQARRSVDAPPTQDAKGLSGVMFREADTPAAPPTVPLQNDPLAGAFNENLPPLPRNRKSTPPDERPNVEGAPHLEAMLPRRHREARTGAPVGAFADPLGSFKPPEPAKQRAPDVSAATPEPKQQPRHRTDVERDPFGLGAEEKAATQSPKRDEEPAKIARAPLRQVSPIDDKPAPEIQDSAGAALRAAFLRGANLPTSTPDDRTPEQFFRETGRMFAKLADGLRELLAVRAIIKDHAGLDRTQISATLNNPLKLSANTREAVTALLGKPEDGYLAPLAAVEAGFRDLKAHELAILDGVQSAVDELLELFKPNTLERKLDGSGMLANLLQGGRRARLWELYQERYDDIARSARTRFMGRLDDAFRSAYARKSAEISAGSDSPVALSPRTFRP
jgi:type VI secretion system FHA domain protein